MITECLLFWHIEYSYFHKATTKASAAAAVDLANPVLPHNRYDSIDNCIDIFYCCQFEVMHLIRAPTIFCPLTVDRVNCFVRVTHQNVGCVQFSILKGKLHG